jgi:uncharacterized protein with FMN-binding domain
MKKFFVSFGFIIIFVANIFYQRISGANTNIVATNFSAIPQNTDKKTLSPLGKNITSTLPRTGPLTKTNQPAVTQIASSPIQASTPTPTQAPVPTPTPTVSQGRYRDGTYTGAAADASYGTVQVAAVISSGRLADINFLSYPNDRQHSVQVSSYALPILKQEAIAVQSANIDTVSGASYTSAAFIESLGSALNQAL